jgi:hypothetical protein
MNTSIPIDARPLFPVLDRHLIELLGSLTEAEWHAPTIAKLWTVKDVAAHLLDGNLRALSMSRDGYFGEIPPLIQSHQDLVDFLNHLNLSWTNACRRLSPSIITQLLMITGPAYAEHLANLPPFENAVFAVAWAGHSHSPNWFHIAREYTEKFLHQQQIRDAVGKPCLMIKELYLPFINTFMFAFPHTFQNISAPIGTVVAMEISSDLGGTWYIAKEANGWAAVVNPTEEVQAKVILDPDTAWKLFSKSLRPENIMHQVTLVGDNRLALQALQMVSVMA